MTKLQLQKELLKQFKRRFRRVYGKLTDMYTLTYKFYGDGGDLVSLSFQSTFTRVTIIFDNCLNVSILVTGCAQLGCITRLFLDVADECVSHIHWVLSTNEVHRITMWNK